MAPRRTRRSTQREPVVRLGAGSLRGKDFSALGSGDSTPGGSGVPEAAEGPNFASQTLIVQGFPSPPVARALSPNGRAHWREKQACRKIVEANVSAAIVMQRTRPAERPVRLTFRYVFPERRKRDVDNLTSGVTKASIDTMVRRGVLEADDSEYVVEVKAESVYERGQRRLEIVIEPATRTDAAGHGERSAG